MTIILAAMLASQLITSPPLDGTAEPTARDAILALRAANNEAIARKDVAAIMSIAADDYVLISGGGKIIRSKAEAADIWTKSGQNCVRNPESIEAGMLPASANAAESGSWRCKARDGHDIGGRYFAHWKRIDGQWRVIADVYVSLRDIPTTAN